MVRMLVSKKLVSTIHLPLLNKKSKKNQILISVAMLSGSDELGFNLHFCYNNFTVKKEIFFTKQNPLFDPNFTEFKFMV